MRDRWGKTGQIDFISLKPRGLYKLPDGFRILFYINVNTG